MRGVRRSGRRPLRRRGRCERVDGAAADRTRQHRGSRPCGSAAYGKYLYVANYGSGTLARINPRTNEPVKTITVGDGPCGVVAGGGALWVENFRSSNIARVDPKRLKVTAHIFVHGAPWDLTYGFGSVWTSNFRDETVSRIDPKTRRIVKTIHTGGFPACIRAAIGSVWVGSRGTDQVYRIDPDGLEWIPNQDGTVTLIEPASNNVVDTIHPGGLTFVVRSAFGSLWVDDFTGNTLSRYRPSS